MSSSVEWNPVIPLIPLVLAALITLAILLVIESRRRQRFIVGRMVCQLIVVVSLLCLVARPSMKVRSPGRPVAVLTEGYSKSGIDSLAASISGLSIIRAPSADPYPGAISLPSDRDLASIAGNPLWVLGHGLPVYSVSDLTAPFEFIPSPLPEGITELILPRRIIEQVPGEITGVYHSRRQANNKIRLVGPGGAEDSTIIEQNGDIAFSLRITPRVAGKFLYHVEEADSAGRVLSSSPLPVYVHRRTKLEILIVSDYPTFELRYLKNFLADRGYRVSMRNRVSKTRFHQEFANRPSQNLINLTRSVLDATDLIIIDQASLAAMSGSEKKQMIQSLSTGLGILFLPITATPANHELLTLKSIPRASDTVRIQINGIRFTFPAIGVQPQEEVTAITTTDQGRILSGCTCTGEIKVGFQLLRETYQLGLQGKSSAYAALWTPLLEKVARENPTGYNISLDHQFPVFTDHPNKVTFISSREDPTATYDGVKLPLAEDIYVDGLWHTTVWAGGARWHTIQADSAQLDFFDLPSSKWKTLQIAHQLKANANHIGSKQEGAAVLERKSWTALFVVLFVLASGFLWLAPKI